MLATVKNSETRKALLVYASDKAMAYPTEPLPSSLRVRNPEIAYPSSQLMPSELRARGQS